jgi:hypothetical protein
MLALGEDELAQAFFIELHALEFQNDGLARDRLLLRVAHPGEQRVLKALL